VNQASGLFHTSNLKSENKEVANKKADHPELVGGGDWLDMNKFG